MKRPQAPTYSLLARPLTKCVLVDPTDPPTSRMLSDALEPLRAWVTESVGAANRKINLSTDELMDKLRQASRENLNRLEDDPDRAIRAEYGFLQFIEKVLTSPPTTLDVLSNTLDQPTERLREWINDKPQNEQTEQVGLMLLDYLCDLCAEPELASDQLPAKPLVRFEDLIYLGNLREAFETLYEATPPKPAQAEYLPDVVRWVHQRQTVPNSKTDLLLVAPTNGGKNGIILGAALAAIAHDRGPVIVLQPYRAQIFESRRSWQDAVAGRPVRRRGVTRGVEIAGSSALISSSDYRISRGRVDITAIIPEKLAVLARNRRLSEFCRLLIVDEIAHLIDPERGAKLEILLTLARASEIPVFATGAGLSTPTAESVARWLGNLLPSEDPRLVSCLLHNPELRREPPLEYCVWRRDGERRFWRHGAALADQLADSTDPIETAVAADAVAEVVYRELQAEPDRQILVFLEDREGVLELADSIASRLRADPLLGPTLTQLAGDLGPSSLSDIWLGGSLPSKVDVPTLLQQRVGVHTRDVPSNNIENIEQAFREGRLRVLCATRTVEAGINLPVDTVIQVGLLDHNQRPLPRRILDQRLGRSGRTIRGHQTPGRGIIYIHEPTHGIERVIATRLLQEDPTAGSQMNEEYLALLLLTSIGAVGDKPEKSETELQTLIRQSYWAKQKAEHEIQTTFRGALTSLLQKKLVEANQEGLISATSLGQALASALLTPEDAPGVSRIREVAELSPTDDSWLPEVLFAACQVPSIASSKRRPREQDIVVRSPLSKNQVFKSWCRRRPDGRLEFGVPGKGMFSMLAGASLGVLLERVIKENISPSELRNLLRAYIATAWTLGHPVEFPRHINNLNDYVVGQDLGYYLGHVIRAAAWLAHYEHRFLLNLRLSELSQQVELGVRAEALEFMEVCGDHVSRGAVRDLGSLEFENLLSSLPGKLAEHLTALLDFQRRRKRDREERLALDDNIFASREELVDLQRALSASEMAQRFSTAWKGTQDEIVVIEPRNLFEVSGRRLLVEPAYKIGDSNLDADILVTTTRLESSLQRSRTQQRMTILGSEEFLVFFALLSALPEGQQVLLLEVVAQLQRVAHREVLRALYAEIVGSGRYSELEQERPTPLALSTAVSRLLRELQLLYSNLVFQVNTQRGPSLSDAEGIKQIRSRLIDGANELLVRIGPLIQERISLAQDYKTRGVPLAKEIQDHLVFLDQQDEWVRALKVRASESRDRKELEQLDLDLIAVFEKLADGGVS